MGGCLSRLSTLWGLLPRPSIFGWWSSQPSTSGRSYLPDTKIPKNLRYLKQLDAYSIELTTRMSETFLAARAQEYLDQATNQLRNIELGLKSRTVQLNHRQCEYLVNMLGQSINSAHESICLYSRQQILRCMGSLKMLVCLANEIKSFADECSKEEWIQVAITFMDVSAHVAFLRYCLKVCTVLLCNQLDGTSPLRQILVNLDTKVNPSEEANSKEDRVNLSRKIQASLQNGNVANNPEYMELAHKLIGRLGTTWGGSPVSRQDLQWWKVEYVKMKRGSVLGTGAAATVYELQGMGADLIEKCFIGQGRDQKHVEKIEEEVKHMVQLSHQNIVQILHYAVNESRCSMVAEKMDGDLYTLVENRMRDESSETVPFSLDESIDIMLQIAEGMHYIHGKMIVHRDLKPQNILFKCEERDALIMWPLMVKVADFGESKRTKSALTYSTQTYVGSSPYMAPEVIQIKNSNGGQSDEKYPFKSDIYSYAMVCYMILTGKEPFASFRINNIVKKMVLAKRRPELALSQCPTMLKVLIERCWHPEPLERPCFDEICAELRFIKFSLKSDHTPNLSQRLVQFNHHQCEYLFQKLEVAIQHVQLYCSLKHKAESLGILQFLTHLAIDVDSFIHNCCKDEWIVASIMLSNTFEQVALIVNNLELCVQLCVSSFIESEVDSVTTTEIIESIKEKVGIDQEALMEKLAHSSTSKGKDFEMANKLQRRLEATSPMLAPSPMPQDLKLSNYDAWMVDDKMWIYENPGRILGKGSSGIIFKANWQGEEVAIKSFFLGFKNEFSTHASLSHPNIVQFYYGQVDTQKSFIGMELMDGDLNNLMQERLSFKETPFTILESIDIALQISNAVKYMHQHHIVHRDLKSMNILVKTLKTSENDIKVVCAKVCNFGISKMIDHSTTYSRQTYNIGSPRWMAPENINIYHASNSSESLQMEMFYPLKSDVYSFAILCYEILTGDIPFSYIQIPNQMKKVVLNGGRPILPNRCPNMLKYLIERCWAHNPTARPSFDQISKELQHLKCLYLQEPPEQQERWESNDSDDEKLQEMLEELQDESGLSGLYKTYTSLGPREHLGRGTSGCTVYKTTLEGAPVAQKETTAKRSEDFKGEVKILARLGSHKNTIPLRGYAMNTRFSSIILELMDGDLAAVIQTRSLQGTTSVVPFQMDEAIDLMLQVAKGMQHVHEKQIVHRDLKPGNILVMKATNDKWLAKVGDFDKAIQLQDSCSETFSMAGTIRYMAPEVMSLEEYDGQETQTQTRPAAEFYKTDVYSFGMVCYEILAGRLPFFEVYAESVHEVLREVMKMVKEEHRRPRLPEDCPPQLKSLIQSCWHRDANKRPTFAKIVELLSSIWRLSTEHEPAESSSAFPE